MSDLVTEYANYEAFAREWEGPPDDPELVWQLLGELEADEVLVCLPAWLAEEKVGFVEGATPRTFVGRVDEERAKAIRLVDSAAAGPLLKLAHRLHHFEAGIAKVGESDADRREWLERRRDQARTEFETRTAVPGLAEEWLPKSQLEQVVRRSD